jgi:hypothetical protein
VEKVLTVNLRCSTWEQLEHIYEHDLKRSGFFMKSQTPPPIDTRIEITLTLPSGSSVPLTGRVRAHVPAGGLGGRGPGLDLALDKVAQSSLWLIETALQSIRKKAAALAPPAPAPIANPDFDTGSSEYSIEEELITSLKQELESLKRFNPYQVLGLGYNASLDDVRNAFGKLSKRYHPDRFVNYQSKPVKHLANEIFLVIRDSYRRLVESPARQAAVAAAPPPPIPNPHATPPPAPVVAAPPPVPMKPGTSGQIPMRRSVSIDMIDAEVEALLAKNDFDGALRLYSVQAKKTPGDNHVRAGLELVEGLRALQKNDRMEAAQRLEAALDLDPQNALAASKLSEMRRQATTERRGALNKLLQQKGDV